MRCGSRQLIVELKWIRNLFVGFFGQQKDKDRIANRNLIPVFQPMFRHGYTIDQRAVPAAVVTDHDTVFFPVEHAVAPRNRIFADAKQVGSVSAYRHFSGRQHKHRVLERPADRYYSGIHCAPLNEQSYVARSSNCVHIVPLLVPISEQIVGLSIRIVFSEAEFCWSA